MSKMPKFKAPIIPPGGSRPKLHPHLKNFIPGDYNGLQSLAGCLYGYVQENQGTVDALVRRVSDLVRLDDEVDGFSVGHRPDAMALPGGGWMGDAAQAFFLTFVRDAAIMNGLHHVTCSIARMADQLGSTLSLIEHECESHLERWLHTYVPDLGISVGDLHLVQHPWGAEFNVTPAARHQLDGQQIAGLSEQLIQLLEPYYEKAENHRKRTAIDLMAIGDILLNGDEYYQTHSAKNAPTGSPNIDLTIGQHEKFAGKIRTLKHQLEAEVEKLNPDSRDIKGAKHELAELGLASGQAGKLLSDINDLKKAEGALKVSSAALTFLSDASPILEEIGLGLILL